MTKDSKTVSTIRRRKGKQVALALQKIREENPPNTNFASEEDEAAAEIEDKCFLFDDRVLGPIVLRRLMSRDHSLFLALLAIRCANALLIQTQYVPDEYWQSLEVAHKMVFGYGYETWEWKEGLRGYSYPFIFAVLYKVLDIMGLDSRIILIKTPRLVQSVIAAWGDFHLYKLSAQFSGRATAQWTVLCQVLSWFTIYCCTRTLSNSTETSLMIAALSYFPWPSSSSVGKKNSQMKFLTCAALSVIVRPTSALVWLLLCSWHLQRVYGTPSFSRVFHNYLFVGALSLGLSSLMDRIWYGKWIFVQLNFLLFNVVHGGASIYGVHPWHWYISQGFPVVLGIHIFPFVVGAWRAKNKVLLWIVVWIIGIHSFLPHKEFRFIMPVIPLCMHYCGVYFQLLCQKPYLKKVKHEEVDRKKDSTESAAQETPATELDAGEADPQDSEKGRAGNKDQEESDMEKVKEAEKEEKSEKTGEDGSEVKKGDKKAEEGEKDDKLKEAGESANAGQDAKVQKSSSMDEKGDLPESQISDKDNPELARERKHQWNLRKAKVFAIILAVMNMVPALYFCLIHQRGTVTVTKYLHDASLHNPKMNVLFLMPCHSAPYYSYLHQNISMRFLTCEPNLKGRDNYTDEADIFYQNPVKWLKKEYSSSKKMWPSHLVYFNTLRKEISGILTQSGYRLCESFFHTHLPEGRVGASVLVSCR